MLKKTLFLFVALSFLGVLPVHKAAAEVTFKGGAAERARYEYWRNMFDMNSDAQDNRSFFRFKTSVWGEADFDKDAVLYAKLTNEFKSYLYYPNAKKGLTGDPNEVVFDNLYLDINNVLSAPVNLRVGRQDLMGYGEMFLLADGTPGDGSRTFYFNALKASWKVDEANTMDLIYIDDPRTDEWLPIVNAQKVETALNTSRETAAVAYLKNKSVKDLSLEGYYIWKREGTEGAGYQAQKGIINTVGSYAKYDLSPFTLRGQLAGQWGTYGDQDRTGLGGYAFIDYDLKDKKWSPQLSLGAAYLSGDDQTTEKVEGWDPLFSRYPWYSELYVVSNRSETGIMGYWTNVQVYRTSLALKPTSKSKLSVFYNYLRANETIPASAVFSGEGHERGHLPQLKLDYAFSKNVTSYILWEYFIPGNVYVNKDPADFVRVEVQVKF